MTKDEKIKLADFGISRKIDIHSLDTLTRTARGTTGYMSPELIDRERIENYDFKIDIYSAGCVIFELIYLKRYADFTDVNIKSDDAKVKREINKRFVLLLRK